METEQKETSVPAATIRGTYNTFEDMTWRDLNDKLGHVVDMRLEGILSIEVGGWGTTLKLRTEPGVKVEVVPMPNGQTKIYLKK